MAQSLRTSAGPAGRRASAMNRGAIRFRPPGCRLESPAGTIENSPPFQRWVPMFQQTRSPAGAEEIIQDAGHILSSLTGLVPFAPRHPSVETLGYCLSPSGRGHDMDAGAEACGFSGAPLVMAGASSASQAVSGRLAGWPLLDILRSVPGVSRRGFELGARNSLCFLVL